MISRILIVGTGGIGRRHYKLATSLISGAEVFVLTRQKSAGKSYVPIENQLSLEEAKTLNPQIVVLANPSSMHLELARMFAAKGSHLLIEKPISHTADGVIDLINQSIAMSITLLCGYNLRFLPSLNNFRDLIRSSAIGKILSVQGIVGQSLIGWREGIDYRESVSAREDLGGGVLLELSHELDYMRWIFGEVESVFGLLTRQSALEIDVEDSAQVILDFKADSQGGKIIGNLSLDFFRQDPVRQCVAVGERGSLRWNGLTGVVEKWLPEFGVWGIECSFPGEIDNSYVAEWLHFLKCVNNQDSPRVSGTDGYKVLKIIEAIRQSSKLGMRVQVSDSIGEE